GTRQAERLRSYGHVHRGHRAGDVQHRRRLDARQPQGIVHLLVGVSVLVLVGDDVEPGVLPKLPEGHAMSLSEKVTRPRDGFGGGLMILLSATSGATLPQENARPM